MRLAIPSATLVVSPLLVAENRSWLLTLAIGLYYKLHGVHRPVTMKKSIIKRRKRVIPAPGAHDSETAGSERAESPLSEPEAPKERGSVNPDGSVNLGVRPRQMQPSLSLVPESVLRQNRQTSPVSVSDPGQYHSLCSSQPSHMPESLTDENRLAPLTSIAMTDAGRQSSLSPSTFLSPSRKRSFSAAEMEPSQNDTAEHTKRLSSINSILNPAAPTPRAEDSSGSPPPTLPPIQRLPSPGISRTSAPVPPVLPPPRDYVSEAERLKAERRARLEMETRQMRELLAEKERELAALMD